MTSPERLQALAEAAARPPAPPESLYDVPPSERSRRLVAARGTAQRDPVPDGLFRRGPVRPRRQRGSRLVALLRPLAAALVLVGAPVGLGAWMLTSQTFALTELAVTGTERVPAGWVEERLAPLVGDNLITLPLGEVDRALAGHPWIASVAIRKQLPDGIEVVVAERRAAALVPGPGGRHWLADGDGRPIVPAAAADADDLLLVVPPRHAAGGAGLDGREEGRVPQVAQALELAAELARWKPVWAAGLDRVEALGDGDFRLHTAAVPFPVLVRAGELEPRASQLVELMPHLAARLPEVAAADLRFDARILLRPGGERSTRGVSARVDSTQQAGGLGSTGGAGAGDDATGRFIQGIQRRAG